MRRFLLWLTARLPAREIAHQGIVFLERYHLGTLLGWRFYIHRFVGDDPDGVHDHPWGYGFSLILAGSYIEVRRDRTRHRRFGNMVNGDTFHRVMLAVRGEDVWTLFAHTGRVKAWGMLRPHQLVGFGEPRGDRSGMARVTHIYIEQNEAEDGHSDWHKRAPKGRDIRRAA